MVRKVMIACVTTIAAVLGSIGVGGVASAVPTGPIDLVVPGNTAFLYLGHWCGGIGVKTYATGFDPSTGYPVGEAFLTTTCNGSGRGGHSTTFTAWINMEWDYLGAQVSASALTTAPSVNPTFTAYDTYGNELYNQSNSAYLLLAPSFTPTPRLLGISGVAGPTAGGTSVTLTGDGFTGATAVSFGGTAAATYVVNSDTSITAVSPVVTDPLQTTVDVTVTTVGGTSATSSADQFTFWPLPTITGVSPSSGPLAGGTPVTITGSGFTGAGLVNFGGTQVYGTVNSDTSMSIVAPIGEAVDTVSLSITTIGGTSPNTSADQFTYLAPNLPVVCRKVAGRAGGSITVSKCTPTSKSDTSATLDPTGTFFTWTPSGQTTTISVTPSPVGQGSCPKNKVEWDYSGTVTGGTSTYSTVGDAVSGITCASKSGSLALLKGTTFDL